MDIVLDVTGRELGIAQATVATVGTAIIIAVGYVSRPTRAALLWSLAFVVAMLCTYGVLVGEVNDAEGIRSAAMGALMCAPALIWCGFRAHRGLATYAWVPAVQAAACATLLYAAQDTILYSVAFRITFLTAAAFAALAVWESRRIPERNDRLLLPLVLVSAAFVPLGVFIAIAGILFPPSMGDDLTLVRAFNALGMLVYLVCALVSLVSLIVGTESSASAPSGWRTFVTTAEDRLRRAERNDERSWSLIEFRLDDLATIRDAGGLTSFAAIVDRFEASIRDSFPAEADFGHQSPGRMYVLVARPPAVVRISMRAALDRISRVERDDPLAVQLSASAGWATVERAGYALASLQTDAEAATESAAATGGDRWRAAGSGATG